MLTFLLGHNCLRSTNVIIVDRVDYFFRVANREAKRAYVRCGFQATRSFSADNKLVFTGFSEKGFWVECRREFSFVAISVEGIRLGTFRLDFPIVVAFLQVKPNTAEVWLTWHPHGHVARKLAQIQHTMSFQVFVARNNTVSSRAGRVDEVNRLHETDAIWDNLQCDLANIISSFSTSSHIGRVSRDSEFTVKGLVPSGPRCYTRAVLARDGVRSGGFRRVAAIATKTKDNGSRSPAVRHGDD
mmetsp:Transcript_84951/g.214316  ORF Transcript_84951/g.214316 Transcript_84951/m.214316 type:complete len:243 (+) Transcript_84951:90-818(+)